MVTPSSRREGAARWIQLSTGGGSGVAALCRFHFLSVSQHIRTGECETAEGGIGDLACWRATKGDPPLGLAAADQVAQASADPCIHVGVGYLQGRPCVAALAAWHLH